MCAHTLASSFHVAHERPRASVESLDSSNREVFSNPLFKEEPSPAHQNGHAEHTDVNASFEIENDEEEDDEPEFVSKPKRPSKARMIAQTMAS